VRIVDNGRSRLRDRVGPERVARLRLARALLRNHRHILMFSHMRSYSTLIAHLLGSHPQVSGYTEQQQSYRTFADLSGLTYGIWKVSDHRVEGAYLFDKLLHDGHVVTDRVLERDDVLPVYAIREPTASLRSIVAMARAKNRPAWQDPEGASRHLHKRYAALRDLSERRGDAAALFTDSVVHEPEQTLAGLTRYLGLDTDISASYDSFPKTGVSGFGDPTGPIAAGRIVADRPGHDIDVPGDMAARLVEDYQDTCDLLVSRCTTVLGRPVDVTV
jgi:hypothetical protein